MSKEKRAANKLRTELRNKVQQLESRVATAVNSLARERYIKELAEVKRQLVRIN